MRISDWSSDVCSSDLDRAFETIGDAAGNVPDGKRHRDRDHAVDRIMPAEMDRADPDPRRIRRDHPAERAPQAESGDREQRGQTIEIGRASCRARVGQFGLNPVVAVTLKKTTKNK